MNEFIEFKFIIKQLRLKEGFTQKHVADYLEITHQSYQAYESGESVPSLENFIKLANLFDVSLNYLIGKSKTI